MNVYVRELCAALARSGVRCEVFTRTESPDQPATVAVEPGLRVHHVPAGPLGPVPKERLVDLVPRWTSGVGSRLDDLAGEGHPVDAIHANYWLSGLAGHTLKHRLDVPLLVTFHTLDRVKADASPEEMWAAEPAWRSQAESEIVGCADVVLASCSVEADQLTDLYRAAPERIAVVAPGVDHAWFGPGDRRQARRAIGFGGDPPLVLFAGRIQPLKGLTVAVDAVLEVRRRARAAGDKRLARTTLVVVGGPSGPHGGDELAAVGARVVAAGEPGAVRLLPPQRHEMLSSYYRAADVCVVPSRSESFGLVALEAAACGLPVVAAAVGGLTTLVEDGRTGYLIDSRQPDAYAERIHAVLADPALAVALGAQAARRARAYTWAAAAAELWSRTDASLAAQLVACW